MQQAPEGIAEGAQVQLSNGLLAKVVKVDGPVVVIDVNPPLAGEHLTFEVELMSLTKGEGLQKATFGAGCFWGPELAFQRVPGVYRTEVGYSNGHVVRPTYDAVRQEGRTWGAAFERVQLFKCDVAGIRTPPVCTSWFGHQLDFQQTYGNIRRLCRARAGCLCVSVRVCVQLAHLSPGCRCARGRQATLRSCRREGHRARRPFVGRGTALTTAPCRWRSSPRR